MDGRGLKSLWGLLGSSAFIILLSSSVVCLSPAAAEELTLGQDLVLEADEITYDRPTQMTEARGHVRADYGEYRIEAPYLRYDHQQRRVYFPEGVDFFWDALKLSAARAQMDLKDRSAQAEEVLIASQGFYFYGRTVTFSGREVSLKDAWVSTCGLPTPHWRIAAGLLAYYPEREEMAASGGQFMVGDIVFFPMPSYTVSTASLKEGWFRSPLLPHFGSRPGDGLYLEQELFFFPAQRSLISFKVGYAVESGFLFGGGTELNYPEGGRADASLYYQTCGKWQGGVSWQRQVKTDLWQSVLSAKFLEREVIEPYRLSSRPDIQWQGSWPDFLPIGTGLDWLAAGGSLKEEAGAQSTRLGLNVRLSHDLLGQLERPDPGWKLRLSLASQNSWYDNGGRWLRLPGRIEAKHIGPVFEEGLAYEHFFGIDGASRFNYENFLWPDNDEVSGMFKIKMWNHSLSAQAYYNLEAKTWRKVDLSFSLLTHCLRWQLDWYVKEQAFSFGLSLGREED